MADYKSKYAGEEIDEAIGLAQQGSIISGAEATTLSAGSTATAIVENNVLKIGVPKGDKGDAGTNGTNGKDGTDGISATHSWNGTTLTITSASGTSSADLKGEKGEQGIQGEQGAKGEKGDKGDAGSNGKTPVKGTDYFTASDKQELVNDVLSALPTWNGGTY